ncbi:hypothetical protein LOZ65_004748, partial [Ophidiomyces ophidiicola]
YDLIGNLRRTERLPCGPNIERPMVPNAKAWKCNGPTSGCLTVVGESLQVDDGADDALEALG